MLHGDREPRTGSLTGLRAVAVIAMLGAIAGPRETKNLLSFGVEVFFALSGYLSASALLNGRDWQAFYRNRALRILPAYGGALLCIWMLPLAGIPWWSLLTCNVDVALLFVPSDWWYPPLAVGLWVICVEVKGLALLPWLLRERRALRLLIGLSLLSRFVIAAECALHQHTYGILHAGETLFLCRLDGFLLGAEGALAVREVAGYVRPLSRLAPFFIGLRLLLFLLPDGPDGQLYTLAILPIGIVAATALVVRLATAGRAVPGLSAPLLLLVGTSSYELYVLQGIAATLLPAALADAAPIRSCVATIILAVVLAPMARVVLQTPPREWLRRLGTEALESRSLRAALGVTVVVTTFVQLFWRYPAAVDIGNLVGNVQRMLSGEHLYRDIIEPAPPFFFLLALPSAIFARLTGLPWLATYNAYVLVLVILLCTLSLYVARRVNLPWAPWFAPGLLCALAYVFTTFAGQNVGQKEYMGVLLMLPYVVSAAGLVEGHPVGHRFGLLLGALVGLSICIKPNFAAGWILIEGALRLVWGKRGLWLRGETLGVVLAGVVNVAIVLVFFPEYRSNVRLAAQVYGAFERPYLEVLHTANLWLLVPALGVAFFPWRSRLMSLRCTLGLATAGFILSALVQRKGWAYHWNAAEGLAILVLAVAALDVSLERGVLYRPLRPLAGAIPLLGVLICATLSVTESVGILSGRRSPAGPWVTSVTNFIRTDVKGTSVAWVLMDLFPAQPAMAYAGATSALRFGNLWPIPKLYADQWGRADGFTYHTPAETSPLEHYVIDSVIEDLERKKPGAIVVEGPMHSQLPYPFLFNAQDFLMRDPRFREILTRYRFVKDELGFYYYVRDGADPGTAPPAPTLVAKLPE